MSYWHISIISCVTTVDIATSPWYLRIQIGLIGLRGHCFWEYICIIIKWVIGILKIWPWPLICSQCHLKVKPKIKCWPTWKFSHISSSVDYIKCKYAVMHSHNLYPLVICNFRKVLNIRQVHFNIISSHVSENLLVLLVTGWKVNFLWYMKKAKFYTFAMWLS